MFREQIRKIKIVGKMSYMAKYIFNSCINIINMEIDKVAKGYNLFSFVCRSSVEISAHEIS